MNKAKLVRQYDQLSVDERSRLMIAAKIRNDQAEYARLVDSAPVKTYSIRANSEHDIVEAWKEAHKALIMVGGASQWKQYLLMHAGATLGPESERHDEMLSSCVDRMMDKHASYQAFIDIMASRSLPIDYQWLEAFGIHLEELDVFTNDGLSDEPSYIAFSDILESTLGSRYSFGAKAKMDRQTSPK
jgi:hypothetical protein